MIRASRLERVSKLKAVNQSPTTSEPATSVSFASFHLLPEIARAINDTGYEVPSPIQVAAIPPLLRGDDVLGQAQTGTGKTAAFALPLLSRLNLGVRQPQVLILTPTRELAIQVAEAIKTYARHLNDLQVLPIYGGQAIDIQLRKLKRGVHIVVGTPGRIQDHMRRNTLKLDTISAVVLDEADEMLRMGFVEEVEEILAQAPAEKQVALFSATMPGPIKKIAKRHLVDPVEISIKAKTATVDTVTQFCCEVPARQKLEALTRILEVQAFDGMVIFVRTKTQTVELADKLQARGFSSAPLNGDMNQAVRERTVSRLKRGELDILVATDVAARGLDVERVSHVVNFDIPYDAETYIHRIGRTARAGREGNAIIFVTPREKRMLKVIEKATGKRIEPIVLPSGEDIAEKRVGELHAQIEQTLLEQDLQRYENVLDLYQRASGHELEEIAKALIHLVQKDRPLYPRLETIQQNTKRAPKGEKPRDAKKAQKESSPNIKTRDNSGASSQVKPDSLTPVPDGLVRYRIAVGKIHEVSPKHIVGAIANEAGLDSEYIGQIKIFDDFSLVDLPDGMPKDIFQHLRKVRTCGQRLAIEVFGQPVQPKKNTRPKKRSSDKARHKKSRKNKGKGR